MSEERATGEPGSGDEDALREEPTREESDSDIPAGPELADGTQLSEFADPETEFRQLAVEREVRRYPSTIGGLIYLGVLGVAGAGIVFAMGGRWRFGMLWLGGALLAAAFARLVLPQARAGMLHTRRRLVDVTLYTALGAAIILVAATIPRQP